MGHTIHIWHHCHHCQTAPIVGVRYECQTCPAGPDIDLCAACYLEFELGKVAHPHKNVLMEKAQTHTFVARKGASYRAFTGWLELPPGAGPAPLIKRGMLVRPEFCYGMDSSFGGYGFVLKTPIGHLFLTALHVLDTVLKKHHIDASIDNEDYSGEELGRVINHVNLYDVLEDKWMFHELGECRNMIPLKDARLGDDEPLSYRDICVFKVTQSLGLNPAVLADKCPQVGEAVWLAAKSKDDASVTRKAVVVSKTEKSFVFRYDDNRPLPGYCSGAPILNRNGQVVAINAGGGIFADCRFGHGNHVDNIRKHLHINHQYESVEHV